MDDVIHKFAGKVSEAEREDLFPMLHQLCDDLVGVRLFTCSRFDLEAGQAERIYTNDAAAYPLTGVKDIVPNRWTDIVLDQKKSFLARNIEELRDVFPDHEKIETLGLGAAINVPVFVGGRMLGTVNLLDVDESYDQSSLDILAPFSICVMLTFLAFNTLLSTT